MAPFKFRAGRTPLLVSMPHTGTHVPDPLLGRMTEEAKLLPADLIVMSSHRPAMKTYFLGSNAGHVVRYAKCSVLVVRKPALPAGQH